jgi:hypothetical protein
VRYVEQFYTRVQSPRLYAYDYSWSNGRFLYAIASAWAGDLDEARVLLQRRLNNRNQTAEEILAEINRFLIKLCPQESEEYIAETQEENIIMGKEAQRVAAHLDINP